MNSQQKERKKRDTSKKHKLIIEKAVEVFISKGYDSASMDGIAETAGVSKRTVYNHFQSKENLFQEIIAAFLADRDRIKPMDYAKNRPLEEQLLSFARAELYLIDDPLRRGLSRLLTSVFLMDSELGNATRGQYSPHAGLIRWIEAARDEGRLSCDSPALAARIFYGLVEGCITWGAMMSDGKNLQGLDPLLDEIIAVFLSRYGTGS